MANQAHWPNFLREIDTVILASDFLDDQSDVVFVDTITDSGSVTIGDAVRGIAALVPSDGTVADNDEAYFASPNEVFKFAAGQPLYGRASVQFTEANTDDANVFFGFMNAIAANSIVDNGAGPQASGCHAVLEKRDGETQWRLTTRNGSASTSTLSTTTAGGSAYQKLEILVEDYTGTSCQVTAKVNGDFLRDSNNLPIRHTILYASATEMQVGFGVKNGGANLETLNVDYVCATQYTGSQR